MTLRDERPRETGLEALAKPLQSVKHNGAVTVGNAPGVNDSATALTGAIEAAAGRHALTLYARVLDAAVASVLSRIKGIGPAPASERLFARLRLKIADMDGAKVNGAFGSQGLAVLRRLGLPDDPEHVRDSAREARRPARAHRETSKSPGSLLALHYVHRGRPEYLHGHGVLVSQGSSASAAG